MRIGVVTTSFPRGPGDPAGCFVEELCHLVANGGHQLEVLAADAMGTGEPNAYDSSSRFKITRIPAASGLFYQGGAPDALAASGSWSALAFSARMTAQVRTASREWDGMIAHWLTPSALACVLAGRRKPIWAIAHGGDVHLLATLGLSAVAAQLLDRSNLHLNFVSRSLQATFAEHAGPAATNLVGRSSVCPMGIDLQHFQDLRGIHHRKDSTKRPPLVLFLGRLVRLKGVDLLLEALANLTQECRVTVAGAGPEAASLKARAVALGLEVEWPGEVRGAERDELLAAARVVVLPSREDHGRSEGMPRVALEALASGAQLLVTRSGGLAEIPSSICHKVPAENHAAIEAALAQILSGHNAPYQPGHWLESLAWPELLPRLLPGLTSIQRQWRGA